MRCKKHVPDLTSTIGVCASCLRERLEAVLAAQAQAKAQAQAQTSRVVPRAAVLSSSDNNQPDQPDPNPPPLNIPDSASPYVTRRKSDFAGRNEPDRRFDRLFYSTPQVGPAFSASGGCNGRTVPSKKRLGRFWNLSNLFRTRSNKPQTSHHRSCAPSAATASPAWLSTKLNHDDYNGSAYRQSDPETDESGNEFNGHDRSTSAESRISSESSPRRKNQAAATVGPPSVRRSRFGPAGKSVAKLAFCLSPLVRASPNRHWSHKGLAQELGAPVGGAHQHMPTAASFCTNRSRKLADFGRVGHNR